MKASGQIHPLKGSGLGTVLVGLLARVLITLVPPMFMIPIGTRYYAGLGGAVIGIFAGMISAWAFLVCPRRRVPKTFALLLLVPMLYLAFRYVSTYLAYGPLP